MSHATSIIVVIELLGILGVLIAIAFKFVESGANIEKISKMLSRNSTIWGNHHEPSKAVLSGPFSIWCFTNEKWVLLSPCGQPGCDCGPAPAQPGSYEEQVIRKECPKR